MRLLRLAPWVLILLLAGCATPISPPENIDVKRHQHALQKMTHWTLSGRLAFNSSDEKFSANVNWQQQQQTFSVIFSTFLGTRLMQMTARPGIAYLEMDDQQYTDEDPGALIRHVTGLNIPLESLPLWIKGQFTPGDRFTFNEHGLLNQLTPMCDTCGHWRISFKNYRLVDTVWLPHALLLTNLDDPQNTIKIRINQWQLQTSGGPVQQN